MAAPQIAPRALRARLRDDNYDLRAAMQFMGLNVRELAEVVGERHRSTIGHLHSGVRNTCSAVLARRIEKALRVHPGSLFMAMPGSGNVADTATPTTRKKAA